MKTKKHEYSIEDGIRVNNLERRAARSRCFFTGVAICIVSCVGAIILGEMFRYETRRAINHIETTMRARDSICLSSLHVGRTDFRIIVLAEMDKEPAMALLNPSIFQSFGKTTRTQELAHPPTQCYTTRKKAYSIHRVRRESVSVVYTTVNASDPTWPAKNLIPTLLKTTRTFSGLRSYCIQHAMELFYMNNVCDELSDENPSYDKRIEL